jgi:hypothetical protein
MAFTTGLDWGNIANDYGSDFDWYDNGMDYVDGTDYGQGGNNVPADTGPVIPDFTDPNNIPEVEIVGDAPKPYVFPDDMLIPPGDILQPVPPPDINDIPDMGTIDIVDKRPITERPVIPLGPEITVPPYNPPIIEAPDILEPVPPVVEPEVPEITIVDDRPVVVPPVVEPPVITPPDIIEPVIPELPYVPPVVDPEPPYVFPVVDPEPPVIPPYVPPYVPPVVQPPVVVTPPVITTPPPVVQTPQPVAQPMRSGEMINPGFIQPTAFYNTTNPAQSKFFWGGHGPQFGTNQFNAQAYNQVAAPNTPWGLGQVQAPLSPDDMKNIIAGTYRAPQGTAPATRAEAYKPSEFAATQYGQVRVGGPVNPAGTTTTPSGSTATKDLYTADQKTAISAQLGSDWQARLDKAALNGDYATIVDIQNRINSILNPVQENAGGGDGGSSGGDGGSSGGDGGGSGGGGGGGAM